MNESIETYELISGIERQSHRDRDTGAEVDGVAPVPTGPTKHTPHMRQHMQITCK